MTEENIKKICAAAKKSCHGTRLYPLKKGFGRTYNRAKQDSRIAYIETLGPLMQENDLHNSLNVDLKFFVVTLCAHQFNKTGENRKFESLLCELYTGKNTSDSLKRMIEKLLGLETDDSRFFNTILRIVKIALSDGYIVDEYDLLKTLSDWDSAPERIAFEIATH